MVTVPLKKLICNQSWNSNKYFGIKRNLFSCILVLWLVNTKLVYAITDYCNGNDQETGCDVCCESREHIQCGKVDGVSDLFSYSPIFCALKWIFFWLHQEFDTQCSSNATIIEMTKDIQDLILEFHHQKRNEIALGNVPPYEPAKRMATIVSFLFEFEWRKRNQEQCQWFAFPLWHK